VRSNLIEAGLGMVGVPAAAHHVWLDQPIAFVAALRGIFAGWGIFAKPSHVADEDEYFRREAALEARL